MVQRVEAEGLSRNVPSSTARSKLTPPGRVKMGEAAQGDAHAMLQHTPHHHVQAPHHPPPHTLPSRSEGSQITMELQQQAVVWPAATAPSEMKPATRKATTGKEEAVSPKDEG